MSKLQTTCAGCHVTTALPGPCLPTGPKLQAPGHRPAGSRRGPKRVCASSADPNSRDGGAVTRRNALAGAVLIPAAVISVPSPSWALLPDDDDSDLIEKARASRGRRLQSQRETERRFVKQQGFRDRRDESVLKPVQKAVYQLSRSGAALESGNLNSVSSILAEGSWVADFRSAGEKLSAGSGSAEKSLGSLLGGIDSLQSAAKGGAVQDSKKAFVTVVSAMTAWAREAGVSSDIQGL